MHSCACVFERKVMMAMTAKYASSCPALTPCIMYFFANMAGLAREDFPLQGKQPGWDRSGRSFGYHGDDGNKYFGRGLGQTFGPQFGAGDTVGCGIVFIPAGTAVLDRGIAAQPVQVAGDLNVFIRFGVSECMCVGVCAVRKKQCVCVCFLCCVNCCM